MTAQVEVRSLDNSWTIFLKCEECNIEAVYSSIETMKDALNIGDDMMAIHDLENHGTEA